MSSILDALEKVEKTRGPTPTGGGGSGSSGRPPWVGAAVVAALIAVGVAGATWWFGAGTPIEVATVSPTTAVPATAAPPTTIAPTTSTTAATSTTTTLVPEAGGSPAPTPIAAAPVPPPTLGAGERPWGATVGDERPTPTPPTTAAPLVARTSSTVASSTTVPNPPPARAEPRPTPVRVASRIPIGAPKLRVSFLVYSSAPTRRTVTLTIGDTGLTTMREGEENQGITVVRILPDRVELKWQDATFMLEVRS